MPRYKVTTAPKPGENSTKKRAQTNRNSDVAPAKKARLADTARLPEPQSAPTARQLADAIKANKAASQKRPQTVAKIGLQPATITFLIGLRHNNNKDWFADHKQEYEIARLDFERFVEHVLPVVASLDPALRVLQAKSCIFRIFRDVRFTGGASDPYKNHLSAAFSRGGKSGNHAAFYIHIEAGDNSMIGGGIWSPPKEIVVKLRENIAADPNRLRQTLAAPALKTIFGDHPLDTDEKHILKTAPKGYSKDHAAIDLLRFKSFVVARKLKDTEVTSDTFLDVVATTFEATTPLILLLNDLAGL